MAIALAGCRAKPPVILGERMPAGCKDSKLTDRCAGWVVDKVLMTIAFRPYDDHAITRYVEDVGRRLARVAGERRDWKFRVLEDPDTMAFASFGSTVYIARGTLGVLRNEAELAAILGHEMGHTLGGHLRENLVELGRDVGTSTSERARRRRNARDDEIQADEMAVILLARAGYEPRAVGTMLRALAATAPGDSEGDLSDQIHPGWTERLARAEALAGTHPAGELGVEPYTEHVATLIVGNDPQAIAIVDGSVVFARANLALELPPHRDTFVLRGTVYIYLSDGALAEVGLIDARLARFYPKSKDNDPASHMETRIAGKVAVTVTVTGSEAPRRARELHATLRAPRRDELARLHAKRFDPTVPRGLWMSPVVEPPATAQRWRYRPPEERPWTR